MKMPKKISFKISFKTVLKVLWVVYALASTMVWLPQIDRLMIKDYETVSEYLLLDDSWDVTIGDEVYRDVDLGDFRFALVGKGDEIVMEKELPARWDMTAGVLRFHTRQAAVKMYMDGELFYEYGHDRVAQNKTVGSGFLFVDFPKEYQGKTLKIHLYLSEDLAFTRLDSVRLYEWANVYRTLITENRIPMYLGCFLAVFGLVINLITIFALAFSIKYIRMFCISLFSMLMGLWTLCYYNVILVFSVPLYSASLLEYLTLYLAPLPLLVYVWEDVKKLRQKVFGTLYWILVAVQITATTCMLALHAVDVVHCAATLKYMQMLIVVGLFYFTIVELMSLKNSKSMDRLFLVGMLLIAICVSYDLISYCCNRYLGMPLFPMRGVASTGVVIFIFLLISMFYLNLTQKMMQEKERDFLIKSAYTDELTQIHNRRYCMEYMEKIKEQEAHGYTVICFDLNNLKVVNDTYGHAQGDILIKSAADVIAESFGGRGIVARMGGDEFIAIIETASAEEIAGLMAEFGKNIDRKNRETKNLNLSIALGYASCSAKEYNIEKIYQIADNRMYENKKQMKGEVL